MANNHKITKDIGNLRGFSTNSSYMRSPNIASVARNIQRYPDKNLGTRRGYQCQIAHIGGLGTSTYDNPITNEIETVTLNTDGNLYKRLKKNLFFYYNGRKFGTITGATQAFPCEITAPSHGLSTGTILKLQNIPGMVQLNGQVVTITNTGPNTYTLDGVNSIGYDLYGTGNGEWVVDFTDYRHLILRIFTDSRYLQTNPGWSVAPWSTSPWGSPSGESISCQLTVSRAARIKGASGNITAATNASPCNIESVNHNLTTGVSVAIADVGGMVELNGNSYTITVVDDDNFTLDGVNSIPYGVYTSGGTWTLNAGNLIPVELEHEINTNDTVQFVDSSGINQQRNVTATTAKSITVDGSAVSVNNNTYVNQFFDIPFRKGFDVTTPYEIGTFISTITDATNGVYGLEIAANGETSYPAAFIEILEPTIIPSDSVYTLDYYYWEAVNKTVNVSMPGSANTAYLNSDQYENASFATHDDVIYVSNGWDYPQKYDGQTVYRAGMPEGSRPRVAAAGSGNVDEGNYKYAITYEQVDAIGHIVEGPISESLDFAVTGGSKNNTVTVDSLNSSSTWNTNCALSDGSSTTVYGPDADGYQYHLIGVQNSPHTMKIEDTAFFLDRAVATTNGASANTNSITVNSGHGVAVDDIVTFEDDNGDFLQRFVTKSESTSITVDGPPVSVAGGGDIDIQANKQGLVYGDLAIVSGTQNDVNTINVDTSHTIQSNDYVNFTDSSSRKQKRLVTGTAAGTITINGPAVSVTDNTLIISDTIRTDQFYVRMGSTHTTGVSLSNNDPISNNLRINIWRTIQNGSLFQLLTTIPNNSITGTTQTYTDKIRAGQQSGVITNITKAASAVITMPDNGLLIGMQFVIKGVSGMVEINNRTVTITGVSGDDVTVSLDTSGADFTAYTSGGTWEVVVGDNNELLISFPDPDRLPQAPPISKYILSHENVMIYAGGERNKAANSDNVFFSEGDQPEAVPEATNFISLPTKNDDVSGVGIADGSLVVFKRNSSHFVSGTLLTGQFEVDEISPGSNVGCVAHATIKPVGSLLYFLSSSGVYTISGGQLFPTDELGNPVPISDPISKLFRTENFIQNKRLVLKRAVAQTYTKDLQYLLFIPAEDTQTTIRTANSNSILLCYDYEGKNWFEWTNINAAGGMFTINDDLYFHERRFSGFAGNTANLYKQHRKYRLVDYADHTSSIDSEWVSSWQDLGQPRTRKKFTKCELLINRESNLYQFNNPQMKFKTYLDRIPDLAHTIADITTVNNQRNAAWSTTPWGFNKWSGYQDSFASINLKQGTVAKSIKVSIRLVGIDMTYRLSGFQIECVPEFRNTMVR